MIEANWPRASETLSEVLVIMYEWYQEGTLCTTRTVAETRVVCNSESPARTCEESSGLEWIRHFAAKGFQIMVETYRRRAILDMWGVREHDRLDELLQPFHTGHVPGEQRQFDERHRR